MPLFLEVMGIPSTTMWDSTGEVLGSGPDSDLIDWKELNQRYAYPTVLAGMYLLDLDGT